MENDPKTIFDELLDPVSWIHVSNPLLKVKLLDYDEFPNSWEVETPYRFKLRMFGFIPLGIHTIRLVTIDKEAGLVESQESGQLAKVWNHTIKVEQDEVQRTVYTDELEIRAGILTGIVWILAQIFYRHRQRRWRKLAKTLGG